MRRVILLPQAQEGLNAVYDPVYSKILRKLEMLRDFPHLGVAMADEFGGYRSLWVEPFRILYRVVSEDRRDIVGFIHVKRRLVNPSE